MTIRQDMATPQAVAPAIEEAIRNPGIDALRGSVTLLVVWHHTAITYGAIGGWFYRELAPDGSLGSNLLVLFCTINQAWFMGLFFLLAGYYTPAALRHKGPARFLLDRLVRLGLPLLAFGWGLGPITIALAQTHRGRPFLDTLLRLWQNGTFEIGPLWFAEALLIFAVGAVLASLLPSRRWLDAPSTEPARFPSNATLALAALGTGAASVALRAVWPVGVNVWNLQLAYFSGYVVLFVAGCLAARAHWLERLPPERVRTWRRVALIALPVLPTFYELGRAIPGLQGRPVDIVYAFWEPFVAWGTIMALLAFFQRRFRQLDGAWRALAQRAYTIYIIHPPIVVGVALAWSDVRVPALVKFAVTGTVSSVLCFIVAGWLLRIPVLRRVV